MKKIIGVDIGGMSVKIAVITCDGTFLFQDSVTTRTGGNGEELCADIVKLTNELLLKCNLDKFDIAGVGIGCPGIIDSKNGVVVFAGNLNLKCCQFAKMVSEKLAMPVKLTNDANAAALGEAKFGSGKKYQNSILITLGTGIGGGIIIEGKLFEGGKSAGTEIGHTVIVENGLQCTCGRRGCFERYASATALIEQTRKAMEENASSEMWKGYTLKTASGKTAFDYAETDLTAKLVVDNYVKHLACGTINLVNVFRPEVVMLGGGVSNQKKKLTEPLQELLDKEIMGGQSYAPVKIVTASLGNQAGIMGAAALFL